LFDIDYITSKVSEEFKVDLELLREGSTDLDEEVALISRKIDADHSDSVIFFAMSDKLDTVFKTTDLKEFVQWSKENDYKQLFYEVNGKNIYLLERFDKTNFSIEFIKTVLDWFPIALRKFRLW
jgi:hypothetical protein